MELEYFEMYSLSLQNNGVFGISDHSISTLEAVEYTGPFMWISPGKRNSGVWFVLLLVSSRQNGLLLSWYS